MTKDDIMKLAKDSYERGQSDLMESCKEAAVKAIASAILTEREACAKVCEMTYEGAFEGARPCFETPDECAAAIRARSNHE